MNLNIVLTTRRGERLARSTRAHGLLGWAIELRERFWLQPPTRTERGWMASPALRRAGHQQAGDEESVIARELLVAIARERGGELLQDAVNPDGKPCYTFRCAQSHEFQLTAKQVYNQEHWCAHMECITVNGIAPFLQVGGQQAVGPSRAQVIYASGPLWAALLSWALLGETVGPQGLLGGSAFIAAVLLAASAPAAEDGEEGDAA